MTNLVMSRRAVYGLTAGNIMFFGLNVLLSWLVAFSSLHGVVPWALASFALGGPLAALGLAVSCRPRRWDAIVANGLLGLVYGWFWVSFWASFLR